MDSRIHEQRKSPRFECEINIDTRTEDGFWADLDGKVRNMSSGGIFIATDTPHPIGTEFVVKFTIPTLDRPVIARCKVKWIKDYNREIKDMVAGMGCQFLDLDPEAEKAIEEFRKYREHELGP